MVLRNEAGRVFDLKETIGCRICDMVGYRRGVGFHHQGNRSSDARKLKPRENVVTTSMAVNGNFGTGVLVRSFVAVISFLAIGLASASTAHGATLAFDQNVTSSTSALNNYFGYAPNLSSSGDIAIVGAPGNAPDTEFYGGSATVLKRTNHQWVEVQRLKQSGGREQDRSGTSTAISADGEVIVVGAPNGDIASNGLRGSISIFRRTAGAWTEEAKLTPASGMSNDNFGRAVAVSADGTTIAVGAPGDGIGSNTSQGSLFIYRYVGGSWIEEQNLVASNGAAYDRLGESIAISGDGETVIGGATRRSSGGDGMAAVFGNAPAGWVSQGTLSLPGGGQEHYFGNSVDLDYAGSTAIVGAYWAKVGNKRQGTATVFSRTGSSWAVSQVLSHANARADSAFGTSVSMADNGKMVLIGAPNEVGGGTTSTLGEAIVFREENSSWTEREKLRVPGRTTSEGFAEHLSLAPDGGSAIVSSIYAKVNDTLTSGRISAFVPSNELTLTKSGSGYGWLSTEPAGLTCSTSCSKFFGVDRQVTITAEADEGSAFAGWSGACSGAALSCQVTMNEARSVTGTFDSTHYRLNAETTGNGGGSIVSSPAGIDCGDTCSDWFAVGSDVTITATAEPGSAFVGWSGDCQGESSTCVVSIAQTKNVGARFEPTFDLSVARSGSGAGAVTSSPAGINCGTDCFQNYLQGTTVTLSATAGVNSVFSHWTGVCEGQTATSCDVTMNQGRSATAVFTATHQFSLTKSGTGSGRILSTDGRIDCGTDCSADYLHGETFGLLASPAAGSVFAGWTGDCSGPTGVCAIDMDKSRQVTAVFTATKYQLSVTKTGTGTGTVSSSPPQISCGATCSADFSKDTTVTLTATPGNNSILGSWSGACAGSALTCDVTMSQAKTVNAHFVGTAFELSVTKSGTGSGVVRSRTAGIECGTDCHETYPDGITVTLDVEPDSGSVFEGWGGACASTATSCQLTMTEARAVTARFTAKATPPDPPDQATISKVSVMGPSKVKKGTKATYTVKVINSGNATATGVRLNVKGRGVSSESSVGTISAHTRKTIKIKLKPKKLGKVKTAFKVTSGNAGGKTVNKTIRVKK